MVCTAASSSNTSAGSVRISSSVREERALQAVFFQRGHAVTHGLAVGKGEEDGGGLFLSGRVGLRARIAAGTLGRLALCLAAAGILLHAVGNQVFRLFDEQRIVIDLAAVGEAQDLDSRRRISSMVVLSPKCEAQKVSGRYKMPLRYRTFAVETLPLSSLTVPAARSKEHLAAAVEEHVGLPGLVIRRRDAAGLAVEHLIGDIERTAGIGREDSQRQGDGVVDGDEEQLAVGRDRHAEAGQHGDNEEQTEDPAPLHEKIPLSEQFCFQYTTLRGGGKFLVVLRKGV